MLRMEHEKQKKNEQQRDQGHGNQAMTTTVSTAEWRPNTPPVFSPLWTGEECKNAFTDELMDILQNQLGIYMDMFPIPPRTRGKSTSPKSDKMPSLGHVGRKSTHSQHNRQQVGPSSSSSSSSTTATNHRPILRVRSLQELTGSPMVRSRSPPVLSRPDVDPNIHDEAAAAAAAWLASTPAGKQPGSTVQFYVPLSPNGGKGTATVAVLLSPPMSPRGRLTSESQTSAETGNAPPETMLRADGSSELTVADINRLIDGLKKTIAELAQHDEAFRQQQQQATVVRTERTDEHQIATVRAPSAEEPQGDYNNCLCGNPAVYVCACTQATYCSNKCQVSDWPDHKKLCGKHFVNFNSIKFED